VGSIVFIGWCWSALIFVVKGCGGDLFVDVFVFIELIYNFVVWKLSLAYRIADVGGISVIRALMNLLIIKIT